MHCVCFAVCEDLPGDFDDEEIKSCLPLVGLLSPGNSAGRTDIEHLLLYLQLLHKLHTIIYPIRLEVQEVQPSTRLAES